MMEIIARKGGERRKKVKKKKEERKKKEWKIGRERTNDIKETMINHVVDRNIPIFIRKE